MTSSRSEFVQHAIDSAIASRSVDVQSYLNSSRTPILEQADPEPSLNNVAATTAVTEVEQGDQNLSSNTALIQDSFAPVASAAATTASNVSSPFDSVAPISENGPNSQKDTDSTDQTVINAPITNVYGNLEETDPVVVPGANGTSAGLDQTPAGDTLTQETQGLSDDVQNTIPSIINVDGIDSQSFIGNTAIPLADTEENILLAQDISSTDATFGDIGQGLDKKFNGNGGVDSAVDSDITAPASYTEFPPTQGITADNDTGIPSTDTTFEEIDQNNGDKFSVNDAIENAIDSAVVAPAVELDIPSTHDTIVGNDTGIPSTGTTFGEIDDKLSGNDTIENAIDSAVVAPAEELGVPSTHDTTIGNDTGIPSTGTALGETDQSLDGKFSSNSAVESAVNSAVAAPASEIDLPSTHGAITGKDTGISSTDTTFGEIDQSLSDKIGDNGAIDSAVSAPDAFDDVHEPLHSERDSAKNVDPFAPATADISNEIDNALENAVEVPTECFDGSVAAQEGIHPIPPLPLKGLELEEEQHKASVLDEVKDKENNLNDDIKESVGSQNTDDGENGDQGMKDPVKTTTGISSFENIDEKKDHANNNEEEHNAPFVGDFKEPFFDNVADVPIKTVDTEDQAVTDTPSNVESSDFSGAPAALGISNKTEDLFKANESSVPVPEADVSDQIAPLSELIDSKPPVLEPAQFKPTPPEPTEVDPGQYRPTPPEPVENIKPPFQSEPTSLEPTASESIVPAPVSSASVTSAPVTPEPIEPEPTAPQVIATDFKAPEHDIPPTPPSKHHQHHTSHSSNDDNGKSKKCIIM